MVTGSVDGFRDRDFTPHKPLDSFKLDHYNYVVDHRLGRGSFSSVYRATRTNKRDDTCEVVAVKVISQERRHDAREVAIAEIDILQRLGGRNYIVRMLNHHTAPNRRYIALEFVAGVPFSTWVDDWDYDEIVSYMKALLESLAYLAECKVVHHDIKPSNFLYDRPNRRYALIDFGLAEMCSDMTGYRKYQPVKRKRLSTEDELAPVAKSARVHLFARPVSDTRKLKQDVPSSSIAFKPSASSSKPTTTTIKAKPVQFARPTGSVRLARKNSELFERQLSNSSANSDRSVSNPGEVKKRPSMVHACYGTNMYCGKCTTSRRVRDSMRIRTSGTRGYRAPEKLLEVEVDQLSAAIDVWSAGVILLSLYSYNHPFFNISNNVPNTTYFDLMSIARIVGSEAMEKSATALSRCITSDVRFNAIDIDKLCQCYQSDGDNSVTSICPIGPCGSTCNSASLDFDGEQRCLCLMPSVDPSPIASFISGLIDPNPNTRLTAQAALKHEFFSCSSKS